MYAVANPRGGSKFGEKWHAEGSQPKKLAIQGGGNGGLLMGSAVTQPPEMYGPQTYPFRAGRP